MNSDDLAKKNILGADGAQDNTRRAFLIAGGPGSGRAALINYMKLGLADCGKVSPRVVYIGAASGDSRPFFTSIAALLRSAGAGEVEMPRTASKRADSEAAKAAIQAADAVFITGGEVEDGMKWVKYHGLDEVMRAKFEAGTPFMGLSAGSIMMGEHWCHWDREGDDSTASLFDCLSFVPHTFDTHAEDEDWCELKAALRLLGDGAEGCGIPSRGMVVAYSDGRLENVGDVRLTFANHGGMIERIAAVEDTPKTE